MVPTTMVEQHEKRQDTSADGSALLAHLRRFIPYQLRQTQVTAAEQKTLAAAGAQDRTEQMYVAWRRTMLYAVGAVSLLAALWATLIAVLEGEMFPPNWFGMLMKLVRTVSLFALPAGAIGAAIVWANRTWSRWILVGGWLIATLTPLLIALVPVQYVTADLGDSADLAGLVQFCRVLAICLSLTPGAIRAGLWLKSLRPVSPVGAWSVAIASGMHLVVYWIVLVALNQMCGNGFLLLGSIFLIAGPLVYLIGYPWLLAPTGPQISRNILTARGGHLSAFAVGLVLFVLFLMTKTFDPAGELRMFGIDMFRSVLRPGTALQMVLDFVARTFATSLVALDALEQIHRAIARNADADARSPLSPVLRGEGSGVRG